jgi:nucleoside-diphosphate-sugar epimerase
VDTRGHDHVRILITGNLGYVGSVLIPLLPTNAPGANLIGFDSEFFGRSLTGANVLWELLLDLQFFGDVRDFPAGILSGIDAVVHLATTSNDPMGDKFEQVTQDVNQTASIRIAQLCQEAGLKDLVFASSCGMNGYAEGGARKETDPTYPLTAELMFHTAESAGNAYFGEAAQHRLTLDPPQCIT